VIKEPIAEVNAKTDFHIVVEYQRTNRQVTRLRFIVPAHLQLPDAAYKAGSAVCGPGRHALQWLKALQEVGLADTGCLENLAGWIRVYRSPEATNQAVILRLLNEKIPPAKASANGKVKSRTGFYSNAIRRTTLILSSKQAQTRPKSGKHAKRRRLSRKRNAWSGSARRGGSCSTPGGAGGSCMSSGRWRRTSGGSPVSTGSV